jgi:L-fuconolactonase
VLKGVRHVLQAEPESYMGRSAFNAGLVEVASRGLTYDVLIKASQLRAATALVDRHPALAVVLDHIGKPNISGSPPDAWCRDIKELARREHVSCKFSGLVTEVPGWQWTPDLLRPYFDVVLEAFRPARLMFGSDWPVCLAASSYARWHAFVTSCVAELTAHERALILGETAARFYHVP